MPLFIETVFEQLAATTFSVARFVNNDVLTNIFPHLYILSKLQKGSLVYTYLELVIILRLMQKRSPTTNSSI